MGSCDAASAHRAAYEIDIKSKRHNNRTALALFEFWALINPALCLAELYGDRNVKHGIYRRALLQKWSSDYKAYLRVHNMLGRTPRPITMQARINTTLAIVRDGHGVYHQVPYIPPNPNQKDKRVQCKWCKRKTSYVCTLCAPQVGLCRNWGTTTPPNRPCFEEYHEKYFPRHSAYPL